MIFEMIMPYLPLVCLYSILTALSYFDYNIKGIHLSIPSIVFYFVSCCLEMPK